MSAAGGWIDDVLAFWFGALRPEDWWTGRPRSTRWYARRFGALLDALTDHPPDGAALDGPGHVAAVLDLDQFPRHLFRGAARAFATDPPALSLALDAIDRALDAALTGPQRHFLYMPLMHDERPAIQRRSLALFARLGDPGAARAARAHHDTVARFGRFPYRNAALGRASTAAERAWLETQLGPDGRRNAREPTKRPS